MYICLRIVILKITNNSFISIASIFFLSFSATAQGMWTQKTNFSSTARGGVSSFFLNGKAYVKTGYDGSVLYGVLWEYNYFPNAWVPVAGFGMGNRWALVSCTISGKVFAETGYNFTPYFNDWWKYACEGNSVFEQSLVSGLSDIYPSVFS